MKFLTCGVVRSEASVDVFLHGRQRRRMAAVSFALRQGLCRMSTACGRDGCPCAPTGSLASTFPLGIGCTSSRKGMFGSTSGYSHHETYSRRGSPSCGGTGVSSHQASLPALYYTTRWFIEHDTDPTRWRNPEAAEVRKRYKAGIPLHSQAVKEEAMRAEQEALMAQRGTEMHRKAVHYIATGVVVLLFLLQILPEYVDPVPSPVYEPYEGDVHTHTHTHHFS